jgi:hypothetical protein
MHEALAAKQQLPIAFLTGPAPVYQQARPRDDVVHLARFEQGMDGGGKLEVGLDKPQTTGRFRVRNAQRQTVYAALDSRRRMGHARYRG